MCTTMFESAGFFPFSTSFPPHSQATSPWPLSTTTNPLHKTQRAQNDLPHSQQEPLYSHSQATASWPLITVSATAPESSGTGSTRGSHHWYTPPAMREGSRGRSSDSARARATSGGV